MRWAFPHAQEVRGWRLGRSAGWYRTSLSHRRAGAGWITAVGDDLEVAEIVAAARDEIGEVLAGATLAHSLVAGANGVRLPMGEFNAWDWFVTTEPPPVRTGEELVRWAAPADEPAITGLLDNDSPRHSARPGDPDALRWCVLGDPDGTLLAAAAHTELVPGVPHLASIVTRSDQRGRGLGAAVTAWLTRRILEEGTEVVTLGMYADNEPARQMYRRLGYVDTHHFASGWFD